MKLLPLIGIFIAVFLLFSVGIYFLLYPKISVGWSIAVGIFSGTYMVIWEYKNQKEQRRKDEKLWKDNKSNNL
jgi:hypothetical protein